MQSGVRQGDSNSSDPDSLDLFAFYMQQFGKVLKLRRTPNTATLKDTTDVYR